jgi:GxxExxY protein
MPIFTAVPIAPIDETAFYQIDKMVTGLAFDIHNEFGRFLDEKLYQVELARRIQRAGQAAVREVQLTAALDDFRKDSFIDILVNGSVIVETKTVSALVETHRAQVLNYLFQCNVYHGTLLNFRPERVQHRFVSTKLSEAERKRIMWSAANWIKLSPNCQLLHDAFQRVLAEWGSCLDPILYRDALTHFLGGETAVVRELEVRSEGLSLGRQKVHLLSDEIAFSITTAIHRPRLALEHQQRFLEHTSLRAMQWINLNRQHVTLHTIIKK